MKKRLAFYSIAVTVSVCLMFFLTACKGSDALVKFDALGGTTAVETQQVRVGETVAPVPSPAREGYIFVGWFIGAEQASRWNFDTDKVKGDMTLYAGWKKADDMKRVEFDANADKEVTSLPKGLLIKTEQNIPIPSAPEREGYIFTGWFKDKECLTSWNFAVDTVKADTTLYAGWEKLYKVTFMDGADKVCSQQVEEGAAVDFDIALLSGRILMGVYEDDGLTKAADLEKKIDKDTVYYLKFMEATDPSKFVYESYGNYIHINGLKEGVELDTVVIPETIDGYPVDYADLGAGVKTVYLPRTLDSFSPTGVETEINVSVLNPNITVYDCGLYLKGNYGDNEVVWFLRHILNKSKIIKVMPNAIISTYLDSGVYYVLTGDVSAHFSEADEYFLGHIVVEDEYYDGYAEKFFSGDPENAKRYIIKASEFDESAVEGD